MSEYQFKIQNSKLNNPSKATTMADLMRSVQAPIANVTKGTNLEGTITKLTSAEILVDINAKTDAVVLEKDRKIMRNILGLFKVGDKVTVSVLNPESDFGYPVVSLRRFVDEILWKRLEELQKKKEPIGIIIKETIRGGFLVDAEMGLSGFLPNSQMTTQETGDLFNKKIQAYILELNKPLHKIIFSQKPILGDEDFAKLIKGIAVDQKVSGIITNITPFGVFVSIVTGSGSVDGLIHISEIAWDRTVDTGVVGTVGETVEAVVIGLDKDAKRVDLSLKRLQSDPFEETAKQFSLEQKVSAVVSQVGSTGVTVDLNGVEGFIRKEKIPPTVTFEVGQKIDVTVSQIDKKRRKIILVPVLLRKTIGYR